MLSLIIAFVDIALHRRGPDKLPASQFFFVLVLIVSVAVELVELLIAQVGERTLVLTLFDVVVDLAFVWAVLKAFGRERRFLQTATAILGTDALLNVLSLPLVLWNHALPSPETQTLASAVIFVLFLVLTFWSIDISGFVLARAIERSYLIGVTIMLAYVMLSLSLRAQLIAPAAS